MKRRAGYRLAKWRLHVLCRTQGFCSTTWIQVVLQAGQAHGQAPAGLAGLTAHFMQMHVLDHVGRDACTDVQVPADEAGRAAAGMAAFHCYNTLCRRTCLTRVG